MATLSLIPVSEYLSSTYEPDCDYIEGELQERNLGERPHSALQGILYSIFMANRRSWNVLPSPELRTQVAPQRFRVPDVLILRRSDPVDLVVRTPPLICIEVLFPEDRIDRMRERIDDYIHMGVEHIWLIDPITRYAWIATPDGSLTRVPEAFTVPGTPIHIVLTEVFVELDDMLTQA